MMEVAAVAKTDFSQLKCRVIASQKTDQGGKIGEVGLSFWKKILKRLLVKYECRLPAI
jgi:hypothetical protein